MIENKESNRAYVIPKWLSFDRICNARDYHVPKKCKITLNDKTIEGINNDYLEFKVNPTHNSACDLLSSAIAIDRLDIAYDAAIFLRSQKKISKMPAKLINQILNINTQRAKLGEYDSEMRRLRQFLKTYPNNPIYWIELARLYTIKGNTTKANRAVITALSLAPNDRFIVRAGFRFYVHINEFDRAYYYVNKAANITDDPWLRATLLNAALISDKGLRQVKKLNPRSIPSDEIFHFSELIESIGILDLNAGDYRKAKKNFRMAWRDPSENVVAHGGWIIRNEFPSMAEDSDLDISRSLEALTWQNYYNLQIDKALSCACDWSLQEPYSTAPFLSASHLACLSNKPDKAIQLSKTGLIANPDSLQLKNNLAYAYLRSNQISNAEKVLDAFPKLLDDRREKIFYLATGGLLHYKKGELELGNSFYFQSIELSKKFGDDIVLAKAMLNLAIAEFEANTNNARLLGEQALDFSYNIVHPDIIITRRQVDNMIKKNKTT